MFDGGSGSNGFDGVVTLLRGVECFAEAIVVLDDELDVEVDISCAGGLVSCLAFSAEDEPWARLVLFPGMLKKDFSF